MNRLSIAFAAVLLALPAAAADMKGDYGRVTAVATPTWTGFYAGVIGSCGTGSTEIDVKRVKEVAAVPDDLTTTEKDESVPASTTTEPIANLDGLSFRGCNGGGQVGGDLQIGDRWVIGLGGEYQFSNASGEASIDKLRAEWTRGESFLGFARGGWLMSPNALLYVTAGYGQLNGGELTLSDGEETAAYDLPDRDIVMIGAGFEHRFADGRASLKIEYRHLEYSDELYGKIDDVELSGRASEDVGLIGIVWRVK